MHESDAMTFKDVLADKDVSNTAKKLLEILGSVAGKVSIPMIDNGIPHPTWVLQELLGIRAEMLHMKQRDFLMLSGLRSMLTLFDDPGRSPEDMKALLIAELQGYIKQLENTKQQAMADALSKKLVLPGQNGVM